ncbi:MAG: DNA-binding protein WhiA [Clostridia bacterium]|nr:DNA-binding protein WhiA [Clostridia bacterium]
MSFSSEVKQNLSKMTNLANKESVKYELIGYLISNNTTYKNGKIMYKTENEYNINRFSKLLSNINIINQEIQIKGNNYIITTSKIEKINEINYNNEDIEYIENIQKEELQKCIIRGVFLGSGSVSNPESKYHLEMILSTKFNAEKIIQILSNHTIGAKILERKNGYGIYIKDGEEISKLLALIGANSSVLKFEQIRVLRDMKNNINRKVNCETANLNKTVNAAVKQIEAIKKLQKTGEFDKLSESLKEIAKIRIENPHASLVELGQMLKNPIGKSGVNHRLNKIIEIVKNIC